MPRNFVYGLIGLGEQMTAEYLPLLVRRGLTPNFACDIAVDSKLLPSNITQYRSLEEIPTAADGNIVLVTLPHSLYASTIASLLLRGYRDIVIEKPAALNSEEFSRIDQLIKEKKANVFVLSRRRFAQSYAALKQVLRTTRQPISVGINISRTFHKSGYGWRGDPTVGGDNVLFDLGYHAIDLAYWLFGGLTLLTASDGSRPEAGGAGRERASIRVVCEECAVPIEIYVDRLAPSPFEQVTVFTADKGIACTPSSLTLYDRSLKIAEVLHFHRGGEVDKMFEDIESFLSCAGESRIVSQYGEHFFHVRLASLFSKTLNN
jgi:predicted dehydrogenase